MKDSKKLAKDILDIFPPAMAKLRSEWRASASVDMTVPQFRVLGNVFMGRNLIGDIAKHLGVSQPATSMLAETLIKKGFLTKDKTSKDQRRSPLTLTPPGKKVYLHTRKVTERKVQKALDSLKSEERLALKKGLRQIEKLFLELL